MFTFAFALTPSNIRVQLQNGSAMNKQVYNRLYAATFHQMYCRFHDAAAMCLSVSAALTSEFSHCVVEAGSQTECANKQCMSESR